MSAEEIGKAFMDHWYQTRQGGNIDSLIPLFTPASMMTFEGNQFQGPQAIVEKLKTTGGQAKFHIVTTDVQPSVNGANAIVIFVTGSLILDADKPMPFSEFIQLVSHAAGQYHVNNCIFRLCMAG